MTEQPLSEESILIHALGIQSTEDRKAYLDEVCGDDAALRAEVEALLRARQRLDDALAPPESPAITVDLPLAEKPGTQIGPYKILHEIGQGGMGVVYMAEQKDPVERRVALKIIKPGMDMRQVIARFEAERQALAIMDHPNIARVIRHRPHANLPRRDRAVARRRGGHRA